MIRNKLKHWHHNYLLKKQKQNRQEFAQRNIGDTIQCNFCNKSSGAFMSDGFQYPILRLLNVVGGGFRENATCPHCGSKDRERLIKFYFDKYPDWINNKKLLHFAPEKNLKPFLQQFTLQNYINADLITFQADRQMDATAIPLEDASVDFIICNHVLEHIPNDKKAMSEFYRVLKQGGAALLQVPMSKKLRYTIEDSTLLDKKEREVYFGQQDHVRIYGPDYFDRLKSVGFRVEQIKSEAFLDQKTIKAYAINLEEELFLAHKDKNNG